MLPKGFRVCITGGGGHLGRAIALKLAAHGARVLIVGRGEEALRAVVEHAGQAGMPGQIQWLAADVGKAADLERLLLWLLRTWGGIDGWVNNASPACKISPGMSNADVAIASLTAATGPYIASTEIVAHHWQTKGQNGSIVNVASMYGLVSPNPDVYSEDPAYHNPPGYGAAKAAILQYTRYAACHLGPKGIRVNAVSPGPFPSAFVQASSPGFIAKLAQKVPLGRIGEPGEVAAPVVFLLSPEASFVNGHNLVVDGGWTVW